jgi:hypothetical protein
MTIYRTAGAWGAGIGANLSAAQIDGNFWGHEERIEALETSAPEPNNISNILVVGTQMTIVLEDATEFGPFTLPQAPFRPSVTATVSAATYAPVIGDVNSYKRCTNATACLVTLPTNASVAFPIDTELTFRQAAAGQVEIVGAGGVTINGVTGFDNKSAVQGAVITVKKVATNTWDLLGLLAETV